MQYSSNFNFNLPEGTDLWNYLTQTNPNFTALDSILKSVQDGTVTTATEVTSGTAHAVTRTLPDANVIRFTATGVWTLGDTMTIDGTPVTVVKPNGTSLQTGDYIIGSEVLGVLRATQFTVYLGAPSSLDAADVSYDNTGSGLTANNVQDAIDEVNSNLDHRGTHECFGFGAGFSWGQCIAIFTPFDITDYTVSVSDVWVGSSSSSNISIPSADITLVTKHATNCITINISTSGLNLTDYPRLCSAKITLS